ncbi:hypothetical protein [Pseudoclavibacter endophyticus]|uniref:Uncharacterized protein n=1 Tax=Pseudoclavibacter endophyticus TaxID=1778590 RepID=A0A6H9WN11_9MICO|nr:hypothetical protein [Pseudoclavibacter endophyticus]KAB1648016.1 hypothetical protein F8O04_09785 [Pseudoclavibacter endophyticus]
MPRSNEPSRGFGAAPAHGAPPGHGPAVPTRRTPRLGWILLIVAVIAAIAAVGVLVLPGVLSSAFDPEDPRGDEQLSPFTGELPMSESHGLGERPRVAVDRGDDWDVGSVYLDGDLRQEQYTYEPAECAGIVIIETGVGELEGSGSDREASEAHMAATIGGAPADVQTVAVAAFGGGSIEFALAEYESSSPELPHVQVATRAFADSGTVIGLLTMCADQGDLGTAAEDFRDRATVAIDLM